MKKDDVVVIRQTAPFSKRKAHTLDRILRSPESEAAAARAAILAASASEHEAKAAERAKIAEKGRKDTEASREVLQAALKQRNLKWTRELAWQQELDKQDAAKRTLEEARVSSSERE
jgi:hypothetical protein